MTEKKYNNDYVQDILNIINSDHTLKEKRDLLDEYHDKDIAEAFELLPKEERKLFFDYFDTKRLSSIIGYIEDSEDYIQDFGYKKYAMLLNKMDLDDAVDILENLNENTKSRLLPYLHVKRREDILLIKSFDPDQIGHEITTNFISIERGLTIRQAMKELVRQSSTHDNINTIYVTDHNQYYGAIDLKDLIVARENDDLEEIIATSYPHVYAHEMISDCIDEIREYEEDSIPVLNDDNEIIGVITSTDITDFIEDEQDEDYAKLAGMTEQSDLDETVKDGMKKRLPWLILLLFLGMIVSTVVGLFESVVAEIAIVVCFQSLILDMAANVGTQSLAVTIRLLVDENISTKDKLKFILKELNIGLSNGTILGLLSFLFIGFYIMIAKNRPFMDAFILSGCVGVSLFVAMVFSSLVGVVIPMFFHKIKVDPAVASGPLITTINDLVAVVTYYGLAWLLLIQIFHVH